MSNFVNELREVFIKHGIVEISHQDDKQSDSGLSLKNISVFLEKNNYENELSDLIDIIDSDVEQVLYPYFKGLDKLHTILPNSYEYKMKKTLLDLFSVIHKYKNNTEPKKIALLFGGAGFIGKHLMEYYQNKNFDIICVDPSAPTELNEHCINEDDPKSKITYFRFNFSEENEYKVIMDALGAYQKIEIWHLASVVGVDNHLHPTFYEAMALHQLILNFCKKLRDPCGGFFNFQDISFWFTSTSELYGNIYNPYYEFPDYTLKFDTFWDSSLGNGGFRSDYIYQKYLGENLFKQLEPLGIKVRNLRLFNIVGKYQSPTKGVFPKFIHNILMDKECLVTDSFRSYTLIDELIERITKINEEWIHVLYELENSGKLDVVRPEYSLTGKKLYEYIFDFLKAESIIINQEPKFKEIQTKEIKFRGDPNIDLSFEDFVKEFGVVIKEIVSEFKKENNDI